MKISALVLASCLVAAWTVPAVAGDFRQITTEDEFLQLAADKKMYLGKNWVVSKKNGQVVGDFGGKKLKGAWAWRDQYWCRTLTTHSKNTDCQKWEVSGNEFRVTRERGKGKSFVYVVK